MHSLVIIGPPGSGKSTVGKQIAKQYDMVYFSSGDMFRTLEKKPKSERTDFENKIVQAFENGLLVEDAQVMRMMQEYFSTFHLRMQNVVFDDFPINMEQLQLFDKWCLKHGQVVSAIIHLIAHPKIALERMKERARIEQRQDDLREEILLKKLEIYYEKTAPVVEHYRRFRFKVIDVDASQDANMVIAQIINKLSVK